jgi:hypothetical protein
MRRMGAEGLALLAISDVVQWIMRGEFCQLR